MTDIIRNNINLFEKYYGGGLNKEDRIILTVAFRLTVSFIQRYDIPTELIDKVKAQLTLFKERLSGEELNYFNTTVDTTVLN